MLDSYVEFVGLAAAVLTTAAFVPQSIKTIRTKETTGLSLLTFSMICVGTFLWLLYGYWTNDVPLILANSITTILSGIISIMILSSRKKR